jgi:hypothetical protein
LIFAADEALWAVYWFRGNETFVLYRGPGVVLITLLAIVVTLAVTTSDRNVLGTLTNRQLWMTILLVSAAALAGPAIATNLLTFGTDSPPDSSVEVRDYTVYYAEDVENEMVSVVDVEALGETTQVRSSGVIVVSERRHIWTQAVSKGRLAFAGRVGVDVGGVGWREEVDALRRGWSAVGNRTAYMIWLRPPDGDWRLSYTSPPTTAEPTIAGRNVSIVPARGTFYLRVESNNRTLGRTPIPKNNQSASVGGLELVRVDGAVFAVANETRVRVATKEKYREASS